MVSLSLSIERATVCFALGRTGETASIDDSS